MTHLSLVAIILVAKPSPVSIVTLVAIVSTAQGTLPCLQGLYEALVSVLNPCLILAKRAPDSSTNDLSGVCPPQLGQPQIRPSQLQSTVLGHIMLKPSGLKQLWLGQHQAAYSCMLWFVDALYSCMEDLACWTPQDAAQCMIDRRHWQPYLDLISEPTRNLCTCAQTCTLLSCSACILMSGAVCTMPSRRSASAFSKTGVCCIVSPHPSPFTGPSCHHSNREIIFLNLLADRRGTATPTVVQTLAVYACYASITTEKPIID